MKLNIVKTRKAWTRAYEINMGSDVIAWINIQQDNKTHYCTSPLEDLDAVLNPWMSDIKFDNFDNALEFALSAITNWCQQLSDDLKQIDLKNLEIEEEPYVPSAGAMYGA